MPSGISHILLSRFLPIDKESSYAYKIMANGRYFQIGSIAPDLPYASLADNKFLEQEVYLANLFHFTEDEQNVALSPNRIPLLGLDRIKTIIQQGGNRRECDALFWFIVGYASHVIADGVCHPFVQDKVGRYEGTNKADHRALEMGIDVLLFKHFTEGTGHSIETSYSRMDTYIGGFNDLKYANFVFDNLSEYINNIYNENIPPDTIKGWVPGMKRLFCLSTGRWPDWLRNLPETVAFIFRRMTDLEGKEEDYYVLRKPRFWDENFLNIPMVHFVNDCLPRYNQLMINFIDKAYAYVYETGTQLTEVDLPAFSLDTGRTVNDPDNLNNIPLLWEAA